MPDRYYIINDKGEKEYVDPGKMGKDLLKKKVYKENETLKSDATKVVSTGKDIQPVKLNTKNKTAPIVNNNQKMDYYANMPWAKPEETKKVPAQSIQKIPTEKAPIEYLKSKQQPTSEKDNEINKIIDTLPENIWNMPVEKGINFINETLGKHIIDADKDKFYIDPVYGKKQLLFDITPGGKDDDIYTSKINKNKEILSGILKNKFDNIQLRRLNLDIIDKAEKLKNEYSNLYFTDEVDEFGTKKTVFEKTDNEVINKYNIFAKDSRRINPLIPNGPAKTEALLGLDKVDLNQPGNLKEYYTRYAKFYADDVTNKLIPESLIHNTFLKDHKDISFFVKNFKTYKDYNKNASDSDAADYAMAQTMDDLILDSRKNVISNLEKDYNKKHGIDEVTAAVNKNLLNRTLDKDIDANSYEKLDVSIKNLNKKIILDEANTLIKYNDNNPDKIKRLYNDAKNLGINVDKYINIDINNNIVDEDGKIINKGLDIFKKDLTTNINIGNNKIASINFENNQLIDRIDFNNEKLNELAKIDNITGKYGTKLFTSLASTGGNLLYTAEKGLSELVTIMTGNDNNIFSKALDNTKSTLEYLSNWKNSYKDETPDNIFLKTGKWVGDVLAEMPGMLPMMYAPETYFAQAGIWGITSATSKFTEMDMSDPGTYSTWQKALEPIAYGLTDAAVGAIFHANSVRMAAKNTFVKNATDKFTKFEYASENLKNIISSGATSSAILVGAGMTRNLISGIPIFEGINDNAMTGAFFGIGLRPFGLLKGIVGKKFLTRTELQKVDDLYKELDDIGKKVEGGNKSDILINRAKDIKVELASIYNKNNNKISDLNNDVLTNIMHTLNEKSSLTRDARNIYFNTELSAKEKNMLLDLYNQKFNRNKIILESLLDPRRKEQNIGIFKNLPQEQYNEYIRKAEELIDDTDNFHNNPDLKDSLGDPTIRRAYSLWMDDMINEHTSKAVKSGDLILADKISDAHSIIDADYNKSINVIKELIKKTEDKDKIDNYNKNIKDLETLRDQTKKNINTIESGGARDGGVKYTFNDIDKNGNVIKVDRALAIRENMKFYGRYTTGIHENSHVMTDNELDAFMKDKSQSEKDAFVSKIVNSIKNVLFTQKDHNKYHNELYNSWLDMIGKYGTGKNVSDYEAFAMLHEAIAEFSKKYDTQKNTDAKSALLDVTAVYGGEGNLNSINKSNDLIKTMVDIVDGLKSGNNTSELYKNLFSIINNGGDFMYKKGTPTLFQRLTGKVFPKLTYVEERTINARYSSGIGIDEMLDDLVKDKNGNPKYKSKEEWSRSNDLGKIYNMIMNTNVFDNIIKKKATEHGLDARTLDMQEVKDILSMRVITNYDPVKNESLFGYLLGKNGIVDYALLDLMKSHAERIKTESLDIEQGEIGAVSEAAREIESGIDIEQAITRAEGELTEEKAKNKLIETSAVDENILKKLDESTPKVMRTLNNNILEKAKTVNVNILPAVKELGESLSSVLYSDVRKLMGNKENNTFRNYLLNNKKALLDNLTTTWLMGKDNGKEVLGGLPIFIEKSVNKQWLKYPEWIGKKIDRETAIERGNTSGLLMVRRVEDVNSIPDDLYLKYFLDSNGNLLKNKQESLAKEVAKEIGLEYVSKELNNPASDVSRALEENQILKYNLKDDINLAEIQKILERGTIKRMEGFSAEGNEIIEKLEKKFKILVGMTSGKQKSEKLDTGKNYLLQELIDLCEEGTAGKNISNSERKYFEEKYFYFQNYQRDSEILGAKMTEHIIRLNMFDALRKAGIKFSYEVKTGGNRSGADLILNIKGDRYLFEFKKNKSARLISIDVKLNDGADNKTIMSIVHPDKKTADLLAAKLNKFLDFVNKNKKYISYTESGYLLMKPENIHIIREFINNAVNRNENLGVTYDAANKLLLNNGASEVIYGEIGAITFNAKNKFGIKNVIDTNNTMATRLVLYKIGEIGDKIKLRLKLEGTLSKTDIEAHNKYYSENPNELIKLLTLKDTNNAIKKFIKENETKIPNADEIQHVNDVTNAVENQNIKQSKGLSALDLDDTLIKSKSKVLYSMPDGKTGKLTPEEYAKYGDELLDVGAKFDFSEFKNIVDGEKGPLFEQTLERLKKFGNDNIFILTARPEEAKRPIFEFLNDMGVKLKEENIICLSNSAAEAKADWITKKAAEGYNDFYFADDSYKNVDAVQKVINGLGLDGRSENSIVRRSEGLSAEFNNILERKSGIESYKEFSDIVARMRGAKKGRFNILNAPSAEDFIGLYYRFLGKGEQGTMDNKFFHENLVQPYTDGIAAIEVAKQSINRDYKALKLKHKDVRGLLNTRVPGGDFTYDQALRVYLWNKAGYEVPGLSKRDNTRLVDLIQTNEEFKNFADDMFLISKRDKWLEPETYWDAQTITSDLHELTESVNRKMYLQKFTENVDAVFTDKNLNKIEAIYGTKFRDALEDSIYRMKNGTNREAGSSKLMNSWNNWVNNAIGGIMFFNRRSAVFQLLSTINYINLADNNPIKAAEAFANQPQYWSDWAKIFNSDKLKERRGGLKADVQEAEIANAAKNSKNKMSAILSYLLKIGFIPNQIMDSVSIASGGATFYRNRINTYLKQGLDKVEAESKAWQDFSEFTERTQQSGDPMLISQEQASPLGRLVLAFQNTAGQYTRLMKRSAQDLIARRRIEGLTQTQSDLQNVSQILFYGFIQNAIFSTVQGVVGSLLSDDEEEMKKEKYLSNTQKVLNDMSDTVLRGLGVQGAVVSTVKNTLLKYLEQQEKNPFKRDETSVLLTAMSISPPIGSKARKLYSAVKTKDWEKDVIDKRGFGVMIDGRFQLSPMYNVMGSLAAATTNVPIDRMVDEINSSTEMFDSRNSMMQRMALALGWRTWDVGAKVEEHEAIKTEAKKVRKEEGKEKAKETRKLNRMKKQAAIYNMTLEEYKRYIGE